MSKRDYTVQMWDHKWYLDKFAKHECCHCSLVHDTEFKVEGYAKEKGFRDLSFGPACVTTINPKLPESHPDMVKVWWDPLEGADYLKFLRRQT